MEIAGVVVGFVIILILNTRKIDMGISLFAGALTAGIIMQYNPKKLLLIFYNSILEPVTLQLIIIVAILSGFGFLLKKTGDLDIMIQSLISLFKGGKILSVILPALIGTMAVPGGAILSAPMIDKSGEMISLDIYKKTSANVFFRHIGFLIYPLYGSMIVASELADISKGTIIRYDLLPMLIGLVSAYYIIFIRGNKSVKTENGFEEDNKIKHLGKFLASFMPIMIVLILALLVNLPFYLAVFVGLLVGAARNLPSNDSINTFIRRIYDFFKNGVKYKLVFLIMGVMAFKGIVESSGAVIGIATFLTDTGIPLSIMIAFLSLLVGFLTGINIAAVGILIPIFLPLIPDGSIGLYISLMFVSSFVGYILSPIHLCLVLTKEYFKAGFMPVYRLLIIPLSLMIITALLQIKIL